MPGYNRHKVAPLSVLPSLSATSNIPNIGDLVQNMNDLSTRANIDTVSQDSSNYSVDPPDSLIPVWPAEDSSRHVKKLSWNDDRVTIYFQLDINICMGKSITFRQKCECVDHRFGHQFFSRK